MWTDKNITVVPYSNWFTNNTATYADNIGSLPTNLKTQLNDTSLEMSETKLLDILERLKNSPEPKH